MAHELELNSTGNIEAAFRVKPAWHRLGHVLPADEPFESFGRKAGLTTWEVKAAPVQYDTGMDSIGTDPTKSVLFRSDTGAALGVVGQHYKIVQPAEIFQFFAEFSDAHGFEMESAGVLRGGARFWALARMPGSMDLGGDKSFPYCLFSSSADGSSATEARGTMVRVVCANTLAMATGSEAAFKLSHRSVYKAADAIRAMANLHSAFEQRATELTALANFKMTSEQASLVLAGLLNPKAVDLVTGTTNGEVIDEVFKSKGWQSVMGLFSGGGQGAMTDTSRGTAFGLLNAITEHYDHHAVARNDENRFLAGQYGAGARAKTAAMDTLTRLVAA